MAKRLIPSLWLVRKLWSLQALHMCARVLYWSMKKLNYLWVWNMNWNPLTLKLVPCFGCFFPVLTAKAENPAGELRVNAYSCSTVTLQCDMESWYMHTQLAALYTVIIYNRVHVWGKSCTSSEHCPGEGMADEPWEAFSVYSSHV